MLRAVWNRGRVAAALSAACVAGLLAAAGTAGAAGPPGAVGAAGAGSSEARPQAAVPWAQVGRGWELVQYTTGTMSKHAPTTLYLVSPGGARYSLHTWPASAGFTPSLTAWSGDKTRALFFAGGSGQMQQLNLKTGKLTKFTMQGQAQAVGYTRPDGLNILGVSGTSAEVHLGRYSLTGNLVKVLASSSDFEITGIDSTDGTTVAVSGTTGVRLFSNAGGLIRTLAVPGTNPGNGCIPARWWNSSTILAACDANPHNILRLWLVPVSGAKPKPLTAQRTSVTHDAGDLDAWQLNSGLFVQSVGACSTLVLNKQNKNGSISPVKVPGTLNVNTRVVTALGSRLLIDALTGCPGSNSLLWFNPGTRAEQWLFKAPANAQGVLAVAAYYSNLNSSL